MLRIKDKQAREKRALAVELLNLVTAEERLVTASAPSQADPHSAVPSDRKSGRL